MKLTALFLAMFMVWGLQNVKAQETIEITPAEKEIVAQELEKEAQSDKHDSKTKKFLNKVAGLFKGSNDTHEVDVNGKDDCAGCTVQKKQNFFTKIGRKLGKGAAWVTTQTAKPFMAASAFVKGSVEKGSKNQDIVAMYQFFLNHQEEFDDLYLEAGTPEEMMELMIAKMEEIMEKKQRLIMQDLLDHLGIKRTLPEDLSQFELTAEEIASIDESKLDPAFINNHPEYKEVKPLIGEMTKDELMDIVQSGYFDKSISFDNYKAALPSPYEIAGTIVGQIFVPKIALGVISSTLSGLYLAPVIGAQIGTGISTVICMENKHKFETDKDLKMFCSYVTNKSAYELLKSRAKGYVAGKKFHQKVADKIKQIKEKRAEKKRKKQEEKALKEAEKELETMKIRNA